MIEILEERGFSIISPYSHSDSDPDIGSIMAEGMFTDENSILFLYFIKDKLIDADVTYKDTMYLSDYILLTDLLSEKYGEPNTVYESDELIKSTWCFDNNYFISASIYINLRIMEIGYLFSEEKEEINRESKLNDL